MSLIKQATAVALSLCLLWTSGDLAEAAIATGGSTNPGALAHLNLALPRDLGQLVARYDSPTPNKNRVILIQDLHAHYGVQKNIAGILDFLTRKLSKPNQSQIP